MLRVMRIQWVAKAAVRRIQWGTKASRTGEDEASRTGEDEDSRTGEDDVGRTGGVEVSRTGEDSWVTRTLDGCGRPGRPGGAIGLVPRRVVADRRVRFLGRPGPIVP